MAEPAYKAATLTAPSYWASYFVNGDASGITPEERRRADAWLRNNRVCYVHDVVRDDGGEAMESRFTWSYKLYDPLADVTGGDVLDYVCSVAP